jgi:transcriptional regulator with GAF, ATPase, and Fis domain
MSVPYPSHDQLTPSELARFAPGADEGLGDLLRRGLDWLARVAPYELATVFALEGDALVVRAARGPLADERVRGHRLALASFPTIREAIELRRARAFTEADHRTGDGDPFDGLLDLSPGHACMVVPLFAGGRTLGVLTLDRRDCETYPAAVVGLVEVYAQVLSLALDHAERRAALEQLRRHDLERERLLEGELDGPDFALERSAAPAVQQLVRRARQAAATDSPLLLVGEPGTGKARLARDVHRASARATKPFVRLPCAAFAPDELARELCGEPAAGRLGRLALAHEGTLFLDEISLLPAPAQAALAGALGREGAGPADVRILASTSADLEAAVAAGRFRDDLYDRLAVLALRTVPLRERLDDLPPLGASLLEAAARRAGRREAPALAPAALEAMRRHRWPGNLRELESVLGRAALLCPHGPVGPEALGLGPAAPDAKFLTMNEMQREHVRRALAASGGRLYGKGGAAELLGMKPSTLQSRMKRLGLRAGDAAGEAAPPRGARAR